MGKQKTVKRMRIKRWYLGLNFLSMALCFITILPFLLTMIRALPNGLGFDWHKVAVHFIVTIVVAICGMFVVSAAICRKIMKVRSGRILLIDESGTVLTSEEVSSPEIWERTISCFASKGLGTDTLQAASRMIVYWINRPKLKIIYCVFPTFYFAFMWFGSLGLTLATESDSTDR